MRLFDDFDLAELRGTWERRRNAARSIRDRIEPRGMTRPPRSDEERAWLRERGEVSPFVEGETKSTLHAF
jgi:hypothetical protein